MKKTLEYKELKAKAAKYCAYQERACLEVKQKLTSWGASTSIIDKIVDELKTDNFIDDGRFARMYALGKFKSHKWGRLKITYALKQKDIDTEIIEMALKEIEPDNYHEIILQLIRQKAKKIEDDNFLVKKGKISRYLLQKGFEAEFINDLVEDYLQSESNT